MAHSVRAWDKVALTVLEVLKAATASNAATFKDTTSQVRDLVSGELRKVLGTKVDEPS